MFPTVGADSIKIIRYAGEVGGRVLGIAAMENLVPDAAKRATLLKSGNLIVASAQQLLTAYIARITAEQFDQRVILGKGRGVDRGFEAMISGHSETIRTSLPDRSTHNPDYRAVFPNGAEEYIAPTIREDDQLAVDLRKALVDSNLAVKAELVAALDIIIPVVVPAAKAVRDSELQTNDLFQTEMAARKTVVDTLWEERKGVEAVLGRAGKGLARLIFFDFRKNGGENGADESTTTTPAPGTGTPEEPK